MTPKTPNVAFLDATYLTALVSTPDYFHSQAVSLAYRLKVSATQLVTTRAVILEVGNSLSRQRFRNDAIRLLSSIEIDPKVEIIPLTEELYAQAFQLYTNRYDKEWSLVDCISFVVMQQRGIYEALTADAHFRQAGFRVLLGPDSTQ